MNARKRIQGKRWRIRDRILVTLILLTAAILLAVALTFHLFVRAYVWNRASAQLDAIANSVSSLRARPERTGDPVPRIRGKRKFDGGQDRVTGVRGNVVALDENGAVLDAPEEEAETARALSDYFSSGHELCERIRREAVSLGNGEYMVSVVRDALQESALLVCYVDVTAIKAFTGQVNLVLGVIICAALALSVLLSRWISRSFSEPVHRLSAFAEEIGRGDFQRREFRFRDAEFNTLAEAMNRMTEELKEANRKQETFFQNVSHELRTPLTAIRGNAEGIAYGLMNPKESANTILTEADRLTDFVEDILYLSRMGRAAPAGSVFPLDLRDILSLCVSEQRVNAGELSFTFDFDDAPVLCSVREQDARQLFGNLISNAIRYASKTVHLSCRAMESGAYVSVRDDGAGISAEDMPHIFERFYKGVGGKHGIGLSIVQSIVDLYHGNITAENDNGAVFRVRLPGNGAIS